jgi:hypothetical protein
MSAFFLIGNFGLSQLVACGLSVQYTGFAGYSHAKARPT